MERKVKLFLWLTAIGALSYIFKLTMDHQLGLKAQGSDIMWSIFRLRNNESGFTESYPRDITNSSHLFGVFKGLSKVTCEPVRSKRSPWFVKRFNTSIQPFMSPLSQGIVREEFDWWKVSLFSSGGGWVSLFSSLYFPVRLMLPIKRLG